MRTSAPAHIPPVAAPAIDEDAAVLLAAAISWKALDQQGPPTSAELRRRAAVYARWAKVYLATAAGLIQAADAIEAPVATPKGAASQKPKKPASQAPVIHRGKRATPTAPDPWTPPPVVVAEPRPIPMPPPLRRATVD